MLKSQTIPTQLSLEVAFNNSNNYVLQGLCGSGKSVQVTQIIDECTLKHNEVIIWVGYSHNDLIKRASLFKHKKTIVVTAGMDSSRIEDISDHEVILMPIQYYRKFEPIESILRKKHIKKVIIDELSMQDIVLPSLLTESFIFGQTNDDYIKKTFSKIDYYNQKEKMNKNDSSPSFTNFLTAKTISHIVLTTELLTTELLKTIGYTTILQGSLEAQRSIKVNIQYNSSVIKNLIKYCDSNDLWSSLKFDHIFCNSSSEENIINHIMARGSNEFRDSDKCLTIFRTFGKQFNRSFCLVIAYLLKEHQPEYYLQMFYTDSLNQTISRNIGYRDSTGKKEAYVLMNVDKSLINNYLLPYTVVEVNSISSEVDALLNKYNSRKVVDLRWIDDLIFHPSYRMERAELKKLAGMPVTTAIKEYLHDKGVTFANSNSVNYIRGCKLNIIEEN